MPDSFLLNGTSPGPAISTLIQSEKTCRPLFVPGVRELDVIPVRHRLIHPRIVHGHKHAAADFPNDQEPHDADDADECSAGVAQNE